MTIVTCRKCGGRHQAFLPCPKPAFPNDLPAFDEEPSKGEDIDILEELFEIFGEENVFVINELPAFEMD